MKKLSTIFVLLMLPVLPVSACAAGDATGAGTPVAEDTGSPNISSNILTESVSAPPGSLNNQPPGVSALDLSLFGIISLGVIGLFWIRRHTSEL